MRLISLLLFFVSLTSFIFTAEPNKNVAERSNSQPVTVACNARPKSRLEIAKRMYQHNKNTIFSGEELECFQKQQEAYNKAECLQLALQCACDRNSDSKMQDPGFAELYQYFQEQIEQSSKESIAAAYRLYLVGSVLGQDSVYLKQPAKSGFVKAVTSAIEWENISLPSFPK